ncbi:MAG TPA: hypothetical protein VL989_00500 [Candidatus Sulfotelmatobacter sp.]|nr:hypothetical protein [Candidatus Sulfotelmatobacter sp.]
MIGFEGAPTDRNDLDIMAQEAAMTLLAHISREASAHQLSLLDSDPLIDEPWPESMTLHRYDKEMLRRYRHMASLLGEGYPLTAAAEMASGSSIELLYREPWNRPFDQKRPLRTSEFLEELTTGYIYGRGSTAVADKREEGVSECQLPLM